MRVGPIIERIKAETGDFFTVVNTARSLTTIEVSPLPVAYVHPIEDIPQSSETIQIVSQRRSGQFGVMIGADHIWWDEDEEAWIEPLEDARDLVIAALLGYSPVDNAEPIEFVRGVLVDVALDFILWRDIFVLPDFLRS